MYLIFTLRCRTSVDKVSRYALLVFFNVADIFHWFSKLWHRILSQKLVNLQKLCTDFWWTFGRNPRVRHNLDRSSYSWGSTSVLLVLVRNPLPFAYAEPLISWRLTHEVYIPLSLVHTNENIDQMFCSGLVFSLVLIQSSLKSYIMSCKKGSSTCSVHRKVSRLLISFVCMERKNFGSKAHFFNGFVLQVC